MAGVLWQALWRHFRFSEACSPRMPHEENKMATVVIVPPSIDDPECSDDEAWERLFAELTGGTEEVIEMFTEPLCNKWFSLK